MIPWFFLEKALLKISGDVLDKNHSEVLFNVKLKVVGHRPALLIKNWLQGSVPNFLSTYFVEPLWALLKPLTINVAHHIETSQLIYIANQLTGFYMMGTLVVNGLKKFAMIQWIYFFHKEICQGTEVISSSVKKTFLYKKENLSPKIISDHVFLFKFELFHHMS